MNLFKKLIAIGVIAFSIGGSITTGASAHGFNELNNAIRAAQEKYDQARDALQAANPGLYHFFVTRHCTDEEYYQIESTYTEHYRHEYFAYVSAKADLDDLLYLKFMASMNDISNKSNDSK